MEIVSHCFQEENKAESSRLSEGFVMFLEFTNPFNSKDCDSRDQLKSAEVINLLGSAPIAE